MTHHRHDVSPSHTHPAHADRFSDEAAGWDDKPGHAERAATVAGLLREALPLRPDMELLEIGGGTGQLSRELAGDIARAVVTDVAPGMVEVAEQKLDDPRYAGWEARHYDIERDELLSERFDVVLGMLTHLKISNLELRAANVGL